MFNSTIGLFNSSSSKIDKSSSMCSLDAILSGLIFIGNNTFITSAEELTKIENCLLQLKSENAKQKTFNENSFNIFLHKFWADSCGNTNVGLAAYSIYTKSLLSKVTKVSLDQKSKLLTKCLLRRFRTK